MSEKKWKIGKTIALLVVIFGVVILVVLGVLQLFNKKETQISEGDDVEVTKMLACKAGENDEMFFKQEGAKDIKQEIKVAHQGTTATELFYTYEADFGSPEAVNEANAKLHADYNFYMGKDVDDFTEQFMEMGDRFKIAIHSDADQLGTHTARIFFISEEELENLKGYKVEDLRTIFEKKGFSCGYDNE